MKKRFFAALLSFIMIFSLLPVNALAANNNVNDKIKITVRVFDPVTGGTWVVGQDTCQKADKYVQSVRYQIPALSEFVENNTQAVQKVVGNWYFPAGDQQVGAYVEWSNNASNVTMTYWVNNFKFTGDDGGTGGGSPGSGTEESGSGKYSMTYTIVYHSNYPSGTDYQQEFRYTIRADYNIGNTGRTVSVKSLNDLGFTAPEGYKVAAHPWNTAKDGSGKSVDSLCYVNPNSTTHLYAQWAPATTTEYVTLTYMDGDTKYAEKSYEKDKTVTVIDCTTQKTGYTFKGWDTAEAAKTVIYKADSTFTIKTDTTLYAVWEENTPPKPDTPRDPSEKELVNLKVTVQCETVGGHKQEYTLNDLAGCYQDGGNMPDGNGGYLRTITLHRADVVTKFNGEAKSINGGEEHEDTASGTITNWSLTWNAADKAWELSTGETETKTIVVKCNGTQPEIPPAKPGAEDLAKLEAPVEVVCTTKPETHTAASFALIEGTYTVGDVDGNETDGYTCDVIITADEYVTKYNTDFGEHTLSGDPTKTLTLKYVEGRWISEETATFYVECAEELFPVKLVIYRNGDTSKAYKTVALESQPKGHVIDLSTLDIGDYYTANYTGKYDFYGWYNDGTWNVYKENLANPPAGLKEIPVKGWTNIICMVYDYEKVVYFQSAEDLAAYQNDHSKTDGLLYTTTARFGSTLPTADAPTPERTGYNFTFWSREGQTGDVTGQTVNGWTNLYANWEKNIYTVIYTDGVDGEEVFADQTYDVPFEDATPAFNGGNSNPTRTDYVFAGWEPKVAETVTGNATYTAKWKEDKNHNGIPDDEEDKYTVTYTDGVDGEEVFADQVYGNLLSNTTTPAFNGTPERDGYVFAGWKPAVSEKVTGNATYAAQWKARTDLSYTVHYYLKDTTKKVAEDKTVGGQTFNAVVTEEAIRISGYRVYGDSEKSITIGTDTNEIIFYYTRVSHPSTPSASKPTLNTGDHYAYVMGYPDGTVRPNGSITRAEVSTILFRLLSDKTREEYFTTESSFTDVKAGAWYNNSVATLEKAGVIVDTAKVGAFRPDEAITRAELAAMLAQFSDAKPVKGVKFSDVSADHWAYDAIAIAAKMGWIEGYPDGTFRPDATITRAEMMTLVNRTLERMPSDEDHLLSERVMLTFPDCTTRDWFYIAVQEATNSHTYERAATEKNGDEQWTALRDNRDWTKLEY